MINVVTRSSAAPYVRLISVNNMKNNNQIHVNKVKGFTLAEVIIVLVVFSILAFLGPIPFFQSKKLAHENVMHNSARTAVQSYLEHIKDVPFNILQNVVEDTKNLPLPIKSRVFPRTEDETQISDGLFLNRVNYRSIPVVTENNDGGEYDNLTMDLLVTPTVEKFIDPEGREVLEFTVEYHYETNFKGLNGIHGGIAAFTKTAGSDL